MRENITDMSAMDAIGSMMVHRYPPDVLLEDVASSRMVSAEIARKLRNRNFCELTVWSMTHANRFIVD